MKTQQHEEMVDGTFREKFANYNRVGKTQNKTRKTKRPMSSLLRKIAEKYMIRSR